MRKNIKRVLDAFRDGIAAVGDSKRTCSTNGYTIYSYRMPIAQRDRNDIKIVRREKGPSQTTRSQISALLSAFPDAIQVDYI